MSRYIDADVLLNKLNKKIPEPGKMRYMEGFNDAIARVRSMVSTSPTVDVVPREEAEDYRECWQKIHDSYNADCLESYNKGRQEVAREIFEEIEKVLENNEVYYHQTDKMRKQFAELKKKYVPEVSEGGRVMFMDFDDELDIALALADDKTTRKDPAYNCRRGMLCPTCDKALWTQVEIKGVFDTKKITIKEEPNFCKYCGQALHSGV